MESKHFYSDKGKQGGAQSNPVSTPSSMLPAGTPAQAQASALSAMTIGSLVFGLIIGFGAGVLWTRGGNAHVATKDTSTETPSGMEADVSTAVLPGSTESYSVGDQAAGKSVTIKNVTVDKATWVAVHDNWSGKPGNILGAQLLTPGAHPEVTVDLLRETKAGTSYFVVLQEDNGNGTFENRKDLPVVNASGAPEQVLFNVK